MKLSVIWTSCKLTKNARLRSLMRKPKLTHLPLSILRHAMLSKPSAWTSFSISGLSGTPKKSYVTRLMPWKIALYETV